MIKVVHSWLYISIYNKRPIKNWGWQLCNWVEKIGWVLIGEIKESERTLNKK